MAKQRMRPLTIPKDVTVTLQDSHVKVKGPLGTLEMALSLKVTVEIKEGKILVKNNDDTKAASSEQGTTRSLIANFFKGVTKGFEKTLVIQGTGYRAQMGGAGLQLFLGYTKPVTIPLPKGITCELKLVKSADKGDLTFITVKGHDKLMVGDVAALIKKTRIPDPYKHKGVRYEFEVLRKKVGKRAVVQA